MRDSIKVIDRVIKHDLPQGPCWRRYNHDGYGQKDDGSAYDGTGVGRCWPILTGERGHYELAAGRDPMPFIKAMENFANAGGMISGAALGRRRFAGRLHETGFADRRSHAALLVACRIYFTRPQPA